MNRSVEFVPRHAARARRSRQISSISEMLVVSPSRRASLCGVEEPTVEKVTSANASPSFVKKRTHDDDDDDKAKLASTLSPTMYNSTLIVLPEVPPQTPPAPRPCKRIRYLHNATVPGPPLITNDTTNVRLNVAISFDMCKLSAALPTEPSDTLPPALPFMESM